MKAHPDLARCGWLATAILAPLGSTMMAVALPAIGRDLHLPVSQLDLWLVVSYLLIGIVGQIPGGRLADRVGLQKALLLGLGIQALGTVLGTMARGLPELAAARILVAGGGALSGPAVAGLLRNGTGQERRSRLFGLFGGVMSLAAALGPLLGGLLVGALGWRAVFFFNLPIIALAGVLALFAAPERKTENSPGSCGNPWQVFSRPEFTAGCFVTGLHHMVMYSLLFRLPVVFHNAGAGPELSGKILLAMLGGMVVFSPAGGRISEIMGARFTVLAGAVLTLCGLGLLPDLALMDSPLETLAGLAFLGAGMGLCSAPSQSAAMSAAPAEQAGGAAGLLSTTRYLGAVAGMLLNRPDLSAGPGPAFISTMALFAVGLLAFLLPSRLRIGPSGTPGWEGTARACRSISPAGVSEIRGTTEAVAIGKD